MPIPKLRVIFAGTPEFAVPSLQALAADPRFEVVAVYCQPDRPHGRGQQLVSPPVALAARTLGLPVFQPEKLTATEIEKVAALAPDFFVTAAYGLLLPEALLAIPKIAPLNVHASLLPRHRGASPIQAALLAGDRTTGLSFFRMVRQMDAGPVFRTVSHVLTGRETAAELTAALAELAARELSATLAGIARGELLAVPQPLAGVTYCGKITKAAGQVHWAREAAEVLLRKLRAYTPWPGLTTFYWGEPLKILAAELDDSGTDAPPGLVFATAAGASVATPAGSLRLLAVQAAGKKPLQIQVFLRGEPGFIGSQLG